MSEASTDTGDIDEDHGPVIPDPPRRVPFGVAVTVALLGLIALSLAIAALLTVSTDSYIRDTVGEAAAKGLFTAVLAVGAALTAAVAWSLVRNGNTVGPMVVGGLILITGLVFLVTGVASESDTGGLQVGILALVVGLGVLLIPLLGHGPSYLAARRVWAKAEADWLKELATPVAPPPMQYQQPWPGHYPPQQQPQWGAPPPQYPPQYQYPPQPQYQGWQQQPPPPLPQSAPPAPAVSQQAPTEHIQPAGQVQPPPVPQEKPQS